LFNAALTVKEVCMAMGTSMRSDERNVQDWINLVCAALLFISPWALRFSGDLMAARAAWVGGIVIGAMAIAALVQFAEWEEWVALVVGVLVVISPWVLGFAAVHAAVWTCVVLGLIVALASISEIWIVHHPAVTAK
jgi:SPW repeat